MHTQHGSPGLWAMSGNYSSGHKHVHVVTCRLAHNYIYIRLRARAVHGCIAADVSDYHLTIRPVELTAGTRNYGYS